MVTAAAIYARISQDRGGEALGVARQEELCRDLADRKGWPVAEVYIDNDISAYKGKRRPAYERMLRDLETGVRDAVITVDLDRLTRHPAELERFITLADHHSVALANVSGDTDLATSDGRFKARILGAVARQESEKKSERLKRQRRQAARLGKPHSGGRRAYGYERDGATVQESEAAVVREAAGRLLAGASLREIAADFNVRGIPPANAKAWSVTSLRTMLASPRIAGLRIHQGEVIGDGSWEGLVDRETFHRLQAVLGDPRRRQLGRPPREVNLLTGMVTCGRCQATLAYSRRADSGAGRYVCHRAPGHTGCGKLAVAADPLEALVADAAIMALTDDGLGRHIGEARSQPADVRAAARELDAIHAQREELGRAYGSGQAPLSMVLAAQEELNRRERDARAVIASDQGGQVLAEVPSVEAELRAWWEAADVDRRRELLKAVIDSVEVSPGKPGMRFMDPRRVRVVWRA